MAEKKVCEMCGGRKYIRVPTPEGMIVPGGVSAPCPCTYKKYTLRNLEKGWRNLTRAERLEDPSPLMPYAGGGEDRPSNLWITASTREFRRHLKYVGVRQGPNWFFKVVSDKGLMTADFANMSVRGIEILDPDMTELDQIAPTSLAVMTLSDLIEPPDLLVIQLGVKGRNRYLPEVLLETLSQREHLDKATWIWDQPHKPLCSDHHAYSEGLLDFFGTWDYSRIRLDTVVPKIQAFTGEFDMTTDAPIMGDDDVDGGHEYVTISNGMGSAKVVQDAPKPPKKKKPFRKGKH